ncbi:MAG: family 16 glycosylhydrolase [Rikenellaceae bacterium]
MKTKTFILSCLSLILLGTIQIKAASPWDLVWSDEFDYIGLPDSLKWKYDTAGNSWSWGNKELQHYTAFDPDNAWVEDGILKITAINEPTADKNYSSARLVSKADWKYCKVEVRARMPKGNGTWPAIWMLPTESPYGIWPRCGEIDIMEHVGYGADSVFSTVHTGRFNHPKNTQVGNTYKINTVTEEFHTYTLEWDENQLSSYIDGIKYFTFKNNYEGADSWPFDEPFHLLLNLAIGGNLGGRYGVDDSLFPHSFEIDYVRIYKRRAPIEVKLWKEGQMPYQEFSATGQESIGDGGRTSNVSEPSLYIYPADKPNGITVLACPGGAYKYVSMDGEGHDMATWMNQRGVTLAVLKYRLPEGHRELPISDVEQAMRILRQNASEYNIDPNLIGVMGASAGGHLASTLASQPSSEDVRPNFQILMYPVISMEDGVTHRESRVNLLGDRYTQADIEQYSNYNNVDENSPTAFIVLSSDDRSVVPQNSLLYYQKLIENGVRTTLHIYDRGGHGWGFGDRFRYKTIWKDELSNWFIQTFPDHMKTK